MDQTQMRFAMDAHARGWYIFPCEPNEKQGALLHPGTDKPWRIKWYESATNDINTIIQLWTARPDYNIGISCKKSGLLVVDCDVPKTWDIREDGWDQFAHLCARRGVDWEDAVDTYQVETPSKGVHLYYWWPPEIQASQGKLDTLLDVRDNGGLKGGYVVGAGSKTGEGWYHCINPAPVKVAPPWLVDEVRYKEPAQRATHPFTRPHSVNSTGLHSYVRAAPEGTRNDSLFWASAVFMEEFPAETYEEVVDRFVDDAVEAGLTLGEIRATIRSAYRKVRSR
jgi:bifunctional DNA primase/polymerase-like protein